MKCSIAINLVTLGMSSIMAQSTAAPSVAEEAEWVKIRNIKAIYEEAVNTNQLEKLKPYIAENFRGVMVNGREARSYDDLVKIVADLRALIGAGGSYHVKVNYEPGTMFGDLAVANGTAEESIVTGSGRRFEPTSTWLVNLIKEDGNWKLYRVQATMDPVNNVFVRDTVKYTRIFFGGGGVLVGAILGAIATRLFRR
jgi:hypothetical protein